jgi:hypothetical protein
MEGSIARGGGAFVLCAVTQVEPFLISFNGTIVGKRMISRPNPMVEDLTSVSAIDFKVVSGPSS